MSIRTFIALPVHPGPGTLDDLEDLKLSLKGERISWVEQDNFHVTIRFIGDTPVSHIPAVSKTLQETITLPGKTTLQFSGPGLFGPRRSPRVVYLGFEEESMLRELNGEVERALESCGIPPAGNTFRAHLTLGRIRVLKDLGGLNNVLRDMRDRFRQHVTVDRLVFYRSDPGDGAPKYSALWSGDFPDIDQHIVLHY